MLACPDGLEPINSYALVAYIPNPLGAFMDQLRLDLVPSCVPHAHITVLPPRPISGTAEEAAEFLREKMHEIPPFAVTPDEVEIFWKSSVIYVGLKHGRGSFENAHDRLNAGPLYYDEPYYYHPHMTLVQEISCEQVMGLYEVARMRWAAFPHERTFAVKEMAFVQNTRQNRWLDLEYYSLEVGEPVTQGSKK